MTQKERFQEALLAVAEARWPRRRASISLSTENGRLRGTINLSDGASYWAELEQDLGEKMIVVMASLQLTVSVPS